MKKKKNDNITIAVKDLTKEFTVYEDKAYFLKERLSNLKRNKKTKHVVLDNINFEIKKGESVALIGVNGSGKSTLLKVLNKIIYSEKGTVTINGKISSMIELGAGFNTDFTGRQNIYFNASMYGLGSKEVDLIIDDIIEFSELGEFIETPVRTYSSGMYMRLAFAIAVNVQAEILLIDEILAVGDAHFQHKCLEKMKSLKAEGKTMVFVSHSTEQVKSFCDRSIWLKDGKIEMDAETNKVLERYMIEQGV